MGLNYRSIVVYDLFRWVVSVESFVIKLLVVNGISSRQNFSPNREETISMSGKMIR